MPANSVYKMMAEKLTGSDFEEFVSSPVRAPELSAENRRRLVDLLSTGLLPKRTCLPSMTQIEWYAYHDSLGHLVYSGLKYLDLQGSQQEAEILRARRPVFWAAAAVLYLHAAFVEEVGACDHDASLLLALTIPHLELQLQVAGVIFLESIALLDPDVDTENTLLDESRLVIVAVAAAIVTRYHENCQESGVPNPKYNPLLRGFLSQLRTAAEGMSTSLIGIDKLFTAWSNDT